MERIVEERKITADDCIMLGIFRLHRETGIKRRDASWNGWLQGEIHSEIGALREDVYYDMHNLFFLQAEMRIE